MSSSGKNNDDDSDDDYDDDTISHRCNFIPKNIEFQPFQRCSVLVSGSRPEGKDGDASIIDFSKSETLTTSFVTGYVIYDSSWSKCLPHCIALAGNNGVARVYDVGKEYPALIRSFREHSFSAMSINWQPFDETFVTASLDCTAKSYSVSENKVVRSFNFTAPLNAAKWNPCDRNMLAGVSCNGCFCIWDNRGNLEQCIHADKSSISSFDWNRKGEVVATLTHMKNYVQLWDIRQTKTPLKVLFKYDGKWFCKVKFSPQENQVLATCSNGGGKVILWNYGLADGKQEIAEYQHHEGAVFSVDMGGEDTGWLASCGLDRRIKIWRRTKPRTSSSGASS